MKVHYFLARKLMSNSLSTFDDRNTPCHDQQGKKITEKTINQERVRVYGASCWTHFSLASYVTEGLDDNMFYR